MKCPRMGGTANVVIRAMADITEYSPAVSMSHGKKIQIAALTMPNKMAILNDDKSILSITVISGVELDEIS